MKKLLNSQCESTTIFSLHLMQRSYDGFGSRGLHGKSGSGCPLSGSRLVFGAGWPSFLVCDSWKSGALLSLDSQVLPFSIACNVLRLLEIAAKAMLNEIRIQSITKTVSMVA